MVRSPLTAAALILACPAAAQPSADVWLRDMLTAQNEIRARVQAPPLKWAPRLAVVAKRWADHLLATGQFHHRPKAPFGENLFEARGKRATPGEVVAYWAAESRDYDRERNSCRTGAVCGHYTQIVWRATLRVGCAMSRGNGREVWVCNYDPPGNWVGERPY